MSSVFRRPRLQTIAFGVIVAIALPQITPASVDPNSEFCTQFKDQIEDHYSAAQRTFCKTDADCAMRTGCPFGCFKPIRKDRLTAFESDLETYGRLCGTCIYECISKAHRAGEPAPALSCVVGQCVWVNK